MNSVLRPRFSLTRAFALAAAMLFAGAWSLHARAQPVQADPPGRVARLSDVQGQVWLYSADTNEWVGAGRNLPLTTGDRLATDPGARAELQVGSTTLRLDGGTEIDVALLDDDDISLQLLSGSLAVRVRDAAEAGRIDIGTGDGRFLVQRAGRYRVDLGTRSSVITVTSGQAYFDGQGSGVDVQPGQRAEFFIDQNNVAQYGVGAPANDAFAAWNNERDRASERSASVRYVSPEMTGAAELDRYGDWQQSADYGALWIPRNVAVGWAPYNAGHWAWVRPWGWTWVDDAPWGFAPFHYGRWVNVRNTWCWTPGQRVSRPVYAPALVAWVGGPQLSLTIGLGGSGRSLAPAVGWFPLAPREVYVPAYRASPRYTQNINITHVTNVTQITTVINNPQVPREFQNRQLPNAVTVVPATVMTSRQPVAAAAAQWRQARGEREDAQRADPAPVLFTAPVAAPAPLPPPTRSNPMPVRRDDPRVGGGQAGERRRGGTEAVPPPPGRDAARSPSLLPAPLPATLPATLASPLPVAPAVAVPAAPARPAVPDAARVERRRGDTVRPSERVSLPAAAGPALPPLAPAPAALPAPAAAPTPMPAPPSRAPAVGPAAPPAVALPAAPAQAPVRAQPPREIPERAARPAPAEEAPVMRPQPVRRGEERPPAARPAEPARPAEAVRAGPPQAAPPTASPTAPPTAPVAAPPPARAAEPPPRGRGDAAKEQRDERREDKKGERER